MKSFAIPAFVFFFIFLFSISVAAQERSITRLSLEDVILMARQRSPEALIASHRYRSSYWQYRYFKADYNPQVNLSGAPVSFTNAYTYVETPEGGLYAPYYQLSSHLGLSVDQKIGLTGGNISLSSSLRSLIYFDSEEVEYISSPIGITLNQPLFGYNSFKWERRIEPMKFKEARQNYLEQMENVAINATNYFFDLLLSQINVKIQQTNLANNDTLYQIARGRYKMGTIAENEVLNMELNYLNSSAQLENALLDLEMKMFTLKSFLRIKADAEIVLIPPVMIPDVVVDVTKALDYAAVNRADAIAFDRRLLEANSQLDQAKKEGRFDVNLSVTYGLNNQSTIFNQVYTDPREQQALYLGVQIPILDWGKARGKINMAESQQELVKTSIEQERIDFDQEVFLKVMQFNMQKNQIKIAAKSDTVAERRYDFTKQRYLIGTIDITELNSAMADKDTKKKGYIAALHSYWLNYYQIRKLTLFDFEKKSQIMADFDSFIE
ncbi:MAG: TolC family protein [Bacteroidales bacterium]|nr:TolC family protein [Bacteroidales bacterium]MDD3962060.1 TolC family protein [Bacteroidales bacterium]MDY0286485.1 TolC family protein [Bacteroidales bacterium]